MKITYRESIIQLRLEVVNSGLQEGLGLAHVAQSTVQLGNLSAILSFRLYMFYKEISFSTKNFNFQRVKEIF